MAKDFVVLGDCNLTPDSLEYSRIVGEPGYFYGSRIVAQHRVDMWVQTGHPQDEGVTWHDESKKFQSGLRLDYGFVSAGLAEKVKRAWIDDEARSSQPLGSALCSVYSATDLQNIKKRTNPFEGLCHRW